MKLLTKRGHCAGIQSYPSNKISYHEVISIEGVSLDQSSVEKQRALAAKWMQLNLPLSIVLLGYENARLEERPHTEW